MLQAIVRSAGILTCGSEFITDFSFQIGNGPAYYLTNNDTIIERAKVMPGNTIQLYRVIRATPERVYRAFLDADAKVKWLPPNGFTGRVQKNDIRVGGTYKMSFTNFTTGNAVSFGGEYTELVPNELIRFTDRFDDPDMPGEIHGTIKLKEVPCGTELQIIQEDVPELIPPADCYLGWQESLVLLAKLVEAEITE
jgi:uncharacterized protein YndB with AHSA1/START domain